MPVRVVSEGCAETHRRNSDLCVSGESKGIGPLMRPPLARGVWPVQKTQT